MPPYCASITATTDDPGRSPSASIRRTAATLTAGLMSLLLGCHRATTGREGPLDAGDVDREPVLDGFVGPAEPPLDPEHAVSTAPAPRARKVRRSRATR